MHLSKTIRDSQLKLHSADLWIQSPPLKSLADALVIKIGTQAYNTTPRTSGDVGSGTMQRKELWSY